LLGILAFTTWALSANAQEGPKGAVGVNRFEPAPAGDSFFGVPSATADGRLVPRAQLMFDYALRPLHFSPSTGEVALISAQGFLRLGASFTLFDRAVFSLDLPMAVVQRGDEPNIK